MRSVQTRQPAEQKPAKAAATAAAAAAPSTGARLFVMSSPSASSLLLLPSEPLDRPLLPAHVSLSPGDLPAASSGSVADALLCSVSQGTPPPQPPPVPALAASAADEATRILGPAVGAALAAARSAAASSPNAHSLVRAAPSGAHGRLQQQQQPQRRPRSSLGRPTSALPSDSWPDYTPALRPAAAGSAVSGAAALMLLEPVLPPNSALLQTAGCCEAPVPPPPSCAAPVVRTLSTASTLALRSPGGGAALTSLSLLRRTSTGAAAPPTPPRLLEQDGSAAQSAHTADIALIHAGEGGASQPVSQGVDVSPVPAWAQREVAAQQPSDLAIALPMHVLVRGASMLGEEGGGIHVTSQPLAVEPSPASAVLVAEPPSQGGNDRSDKKRRRAAVASDSTQNASPRINPGAAAAAAAPAFDPSLLPRFPQSAALGGVFTGSTLTSVRCSGCGTESRRVEAFSVLSLDLPPAAAAAQAAHGGRAAAAADLADGEAASPAADARAADPCFDSAAGIPDRGQASLLRCLAAFAAPEELSGDTAYECDVCAAKRTASKRVRLHFLPPALVFHINRAVWQPRGGGRREKLHTWVAFPLALSPTHLAPFLR